MTSSKNTNGKGSKTTRKFIKKNQKTKIKNSQKSYIYYLFPLLFVVVILPLVVKLNVFRDVLSQENWYFNQETAGDVFLYCKQHLFYVVMGICLFCMLCFVLLERYIFSFKKWMIPLGIYGMITIVSTFFAHNKQIALHGAADLFQPLLVLLGYLLLFYYTYTVFSKEENVFDKALIFLLRIMAVGTALLNLIGLLQLFGNDPLTWSWVQKLAGLTNAEYVPSTRIYMTLYHQDYVGVYLVLMIPILLAGARLEKTKTLKSLFAIDVFLTIICLFASQSRSSIIALVIALTLAVALFFWMNKMNQRSSKRLLVIGCGCVVFVSVLFMISNTAMNHILTNRMKTIKNSIRSTKLEFVETTKEGVVIGYDEKKCVLSWDADVNDINNSLSENGDASAGGIQVLRGQSMDARGNTLNGVIVSFSESESTKASDKNKWFFTRDENGQYCYLNSVGRLDQCVNSESALPKSSYGFAAYRGYTWAKTIPLLKKTMVIGVGPDNFIYLFPNNDYAGRYISKLESAIYNKPHNWYLQMATETGVLSLVCMLGFLCWYIVRFVKGLKKQNAEDIMFVNVLFFTAIIAYLITACFNDSMIVTAPLFWIVIGVSHALMEREQL